MPDLEGRFRQADDLPVEELWDDISTRRPRPSSPSAKGRTIVALSALGLATMAILIATALHAIATGNMLPAFVTEQDGTLRELSTICVDSLEFVVTKLKDRGTHQAFGVVTNAQDFMRLVHLELRARIS